MQDLGFWILNDIVWIKNNPMPNFRGVRFTNAHEILIWAQKNKGSKYTFNHHNMKALNDELQRRSDWTIPLSTGKERIKSNGIKAHPTQKPEALLYRVIMASSNPGDIILDPFFGSGTTGAVAKKLGRNWIGIERDKKYIKIAQKRIDKITPGEKSSLDMPTRRPERIPFGALLEQGLLTPGETLYFAKNRKSATILANGHIKCGKIVGSIHAVATQLSNGAPANGWDLWMYKQNGTLKVIDELREKIRLKH
jgi:modification methylase